MSSFILKAISREAAQREGFTEITTPIDPRTEADIFRNLERQLVGVGGVWIQHPNGTFSAARRTSELVLDPPRQKRVLLPIEVLVDADERRERKGESEA